MKTQITDTGVIKYDIPIEVTKEQYDYLTNAYCGIIAHRKEDGKYWIKVWIMKYAKEIEQILNGTDTIQQ